MAATLTEIDAQAQKVVKSYWNHYLHCAVNSPNLLGIEDELAQAIEGTHTPEALTVVRTHNRLVGSILAPQALRAALGAVLREYGLYYGWPESDPLVLAKRLNEQWDTDGRTIQERAFSRGTPTTPSGKGTILRVTKDEWGNTIETGIPESFVAECMLAESNGARKHAEEFEFRSGAPRNDFLARPGSGQKLSGIPSATALDTQSYLSNPSFTQWDSDNNSVDTALAATDDVTDWTLADQTKAQITAGTTFRASEGETTARALRFTGNNSVQQLYSLLGAQWNPNVPYLVAAAFYRESSVDGALTMTHGGVTSAIADLTSGYTNATWYQFYIALTAADCWHRGFQAASASMLFKLALASRTTGSLLLDDIVIRAFEFFAGSWVLPLGNATPFLRGDKSTWTDSISSEGKFQALLSWAFNFQVQLPPGSSPTVADP